MSVPPTTGGIPDPFHHGDAATPIQCDRCGNATHPALLTNVIGTFLLERSRICESCLEHTREENAS